VTEAATEAAPSRRSRPRPQAVVDRDEQVYAKLVELGGSATKAQLADALGVAANEVYLSLYRLRVKQGRVERVRDDGKQHVYRVVPAA
jgi:predicted transcriptional regulator